MPASIYVDDLTGHELALQQEQHRPCDVGQTSVSLERQTLRELHQVALILAFRRKDQPGRHRIYGEARRVLEGRQPGQRGEKVLAEDVSGMRQIVSGDLGVQKVDHLSAGRLASKGTGERERRPGVDAEIVLEVVRSQRLERPCLEFRGTVYQDVNRAGLGTCSINQRVHFPGVRKVGLNAEGSYPCSLQRVSQRLRSLR